MWLGCRSRLSKCLRLVAGMLLAALSRLCPLRLRQRLRPICVSASWSRFGCKRPVCAGKVNDGWKDRLTCYWRCYASLFVAAAFIAAGECGCQIISVSAPLQGHCHGARPCPVWQAIGAAGIPASCRLPVCTSVGCHAAGPR